MQLSVVIPFIENIFMDFLSYYCAYFFFGFMLPFRCFQNSMVEYYGKQATSWKLDEAILLFFVVNEADAAAPPPPSYSPLAENANSRPDQNLV